MKKLSLVLIDDDQDVLNLIENYLTANNYNVNSYKDAQVALNDIVHLKVDCQVIVTDLLLPGFNGIEFIKSLQKEKVDIPIIIITASKKIELAVEAINAGAYDFLIKPLNLSQFLVAIERAEKFQKVKEDMKTLKTAVQLREGAISIDGIIGKSQGIKDVLDLTKRVASCASNILITGESGTGKEVIARAIHSFGSRMNKPFIAINCSAIPEQLLESEIFGHAKGAFTGATDKKIGLFEAADGGTIFLDEIGDLALHLQAKLLRVLQEKKIKRVGENIFRPINARIISATHKNLRNQIVQGKFREDLFFRLSVIPIWIPPLRDRKEDVLLLAEFFLNKFVRINNSSSKSFSKLALEKMLAYSWPGNVRELENTIERCVVLSRSEIIDENDFDIESKCLTEGYNNNIFTIFNELFNNRVLSIDELVNLYVQFILQRNHGAKEKTAKDLKINRKTLSRRLREMHNETNHLN